MTAIKPQTDEYAAYYGKYIERVPDGEVVETLERQNQQRNRLLSTIAPASETFRYAEGKWSVREVAGHLIDAERVFAYRALCFSRGDASPLPGFDEGDYIASSNYHQRTLSDINAELSNLRAASIALFRGLTDEAWSRRGNASGNDVTVRALAYIMAGHELHHLSIFEERYLPKIERKPDNLAVTGIGGIFFKSPDPKALRAWYQEHLGIAVDDWGGTAFQWRLHDTPDRLGSTVWSPFKETSDYFNPSEARFMINYRVEALHPLLEKLRAAGVTVDEKTDDSEFGKFGWVMDPDGNRLELWQPPE